VGLTGEVRGVRHTPARIAEAGRMGLGPVFLAASSASAEGRSSVRPIGSVREAVESVRT
jgi:predicted ATP-dependent serine protease